MSDGLTWRGKLGFGGACVACCAVPMLVLAGVLSAGAALVGGTAAGSIILVGLMAYLVVSGRAGGVKRQTRLAAAAAGTALGRGGAVSAGGLGPAWPVLGVGRCRGRCRRRAPRAQTGGSSRRIHAAVSMSASHRGGCPRTRRPRRWTSPAIRRYLRGRTASRLCQRALRDR